MAKMLRLLFCVLAFATITAPPTIAKPLTKAESDALAKNAELCGTGPVADTTIAACTTVIDSHRYESAALAVYYFDRGLNYAKSQHYPEAIGDFDAAIKLKPDFANAYFVRGTVKQVTGDNAGGDADIAKAKELDPTLG
jgi:tetratricopeptide (TPR) repeat protein